MSRFVRIDRADEDEKTAYFKDLLSDELAKDKGCRLIGAVDDNGVPEGVVAFKISGQIVDILHIEVYEALRRQGIGTALIRTLLKYLSQAELPFVLQAVYSVIEEDDRVMDLFFRSMPDFEVVSGGRYYTIRPGTAWNSSRLAFISAFECSVKSYTELTKVEMNDLTNDLKEKKLLAFLPGEDDVLIPELSLCHLEDGHISAMAIFRQSGLPDTMELSFLMSDPYNGDHLAGVLNEVIKRLKTSFQDKTVIFSVVNKEAELIAKRFIAGDMKVNEILTAESFGEF